MQPLLMQYDCVQYPLQFMVNKLILKVINILG